MFKKKSSILLLLLLAVFSIGLFSTSYARSLSSNEIKNAIKNFYQEKINPTIPSYELEHINNVDLSGWVDVISRYQGKYIILFSKLGSRVITDLYCYNGSSIYLTAQNGEYAIGTISGTLFSSQYDTQNTSVGAWNTSPVQQIPYTWAYFESGITKNANTDSYYIQPYTYIPNNNIFNSSYSTDKFEFSPTTSNFQVCSINGLVQPSEVYVYERTTQNYLTLGYLEKFSNLDNISITQYRYNKSNGWVEVSDWATDDFSGYNVQNDILTYTIDISKINADTLVLFNFTPNNIEDFTNQTFALYVKSPYTVISNGVIYPSQTFSGDYYNNYNDDSNTDKIVDNNKSDSDKIVDTLTDTSEVDSQLNEFLSGDLANNLGYTPLENPFSSFLYNILTGICNTLLGAGDVTLNLDLHGHQVEMKSSDFFLPSGAFKTFLSTSLVVAYIYMLYKYFYHIIIKLETADIKHIQDDFSSHDSDLF